jgi:hypothetical protein
LEEKVMTELSHGSQAVIEAMAKPLLNPYGKVPLPAMAAAVLRAATDQVLPESLMNTPQLRARFRPIRHLYLAIATELENHGQP